MGRRQLNVYVDKELHEKIKYLSIITCRKRSDLVRLWVINGINHTFYELEQLKKVEEARVKENGKHIR